MLTLIFREAGKFLLWDTHSTAQFTEASAAAKEELPLWSLCCKFNYSKCGRWFYL